MSDLSDLEASKGRYPTTGGTPCGHPWREVPILGCRLDEGHDGLHQVIVISSAPSSAPGQVVPKEPNR